jgi:hypothetical protein
MNSRLGTYRIAKYDSEEVRAIPRHLPPEPPVEIGRFQRLLDEALTRTGVSTA